MTNHHLQGTTMTFDPTTGAKGEKRMREIARENQLHIDQIVADLLANLGRPATIVDQLGAETLAATVVRARRLRSQGKNDAKERREIALLVKHFPAIGAEPRPMPATAPDEVSNNAV
jgi:hypothetical protein